eukprot:gene4338-5429_t
MKNETGSTATILPNNSIGGGVLGVVPPTPPSNSNPSSPGKQQQLPPQQQHFQTPISEVPFKPGTNLKRSSSSRFHEKSQVELQKIPGFHEVPVEERQSLFLQKLKQCSYLFDFSDPNSDSKSKSIKREALLQCVEYLMVNREVFHESIYATLFDMVGTNLFRPLPPRTNPYGVMYDPEEDEPILEAGWAHIQIVYELLLRFIDSPSFNTHIAKNYVDQKFVLQLLELFDSEDPRERDYLKTTLHRIYGKFLALRGFIRTAIRDLFCTFVYESSQHNGVSEILEVLGSIINGFAVPLKDEHKQFLIKVLIPLHKPKSYSVYCSHLGYCMSQFIEKDPNLAEVVFKSIFRLWPVGNSQKEVLFLSEIEDLLNSVEEEQFIKIRIPFFKQISKCFKSEHFQVAERALFLWSNDHIVYLVASKSSFVIALPIFYRVLYENSNNHWNKSIRSLSLSSLKLFMEIDSETFNRVADQYKEEETKRIQAKAMERRPSMINHPVVPPKPISSLVEENNTEIKQPSMIRRKSLLPVDPSTIAALSNHRSLDDIVLSGTNDSEETESSTATSFTADYNYMNKEERVPVTISQ